MFYEEIRIKQSLSYISFCPIRSLYNSKFILMAISLGTNVVVVTRVRCMFVINQKKSWYFLFQNWFLSIVFVKTCIHQHNVIPRASPNEVRGVQ